MSVWYRLGKTGIGIYLRCMYRIGVTGRENIPKKGSAILCCNHVSLLDPLVLAVSLKRPVSFMGKKELFSNKFFSFILNRVHIIPVDRSTADMEAYKKTLGALKRGWLVGIFAQGTRMNELEAKNAKSGVSFFAMKSGAPVVPIFITTDYKRFGKVFVNIGKPVDLDEFKESGKKVKSETLELITEKIVEEIIKLQVDKNLG